MSFKVKALIWICNCHNKPIIPVKMDDNGTTRPRCQVSGLMISELQIRLSEVFSS